MKGFQFIVWILGFYTILDSSAARGVPYWRFTYSVIVFAILFMTLFAGVRRRPPKPTVRQFVIWLGFSALWFIPVIFCFPLYPGYIAGDFVVVLLPSLLIITLSLDGRVSDKNKAIITLAAFMLFGAMVAPIIGNRLWGIEYQNRVFGDYKPPHILLLVSVLTGLIYTRELYLKFIGLIIGSALFALAFYSGQRTNAVLWMLCMALVVVTAPRRVIFKRSNLLLAGILALVLSVGVSLILWSGDARSKIADTIDSSRYSTLARGNNDESLAGRINEARDVVIHTKEERSLLFMLLGHGHGATFKPINSLPEPNITAENRVHNIHIVPFLIFYRYGLLGLLFYCIGAYIVIRDLCKIRKYGAQFNIPLHFVIFTIAVALYYINSLLRTPLNDPVFSLIIASYLLERCYVFRHPGPRRSTVTPLFRPTHATTFPGTRLIAQRTAHES